MTDDADLKLEEMFSLTEIQDEGFSSRVYEKIQKKCRIRQFTLAVDFTLGGLIAFKPLLFVLGIMMPLLADLSFRGFGFPVETLINDPSIVIPALSGVLLLFIIPDVEN